MRILYAAAELSPLARVGGLAEAAAGLTAALSAAGHEVEIVVPDYDGRELTDESREALDVPEWAAPAVARRGLDSSGRTVTLVDVPGIARPHPYLDLSTGEGWSDNDQRFFAFSAAVASLARRRNPDVVHLNDWHTALALALGLENVRGPIPTVFTIHTIGYQGHADARWLDRISHRTAFEWFGGINPLAGAISLADRVIAVSPTYAREIVTEEFGVGLNSRLAARGEHLVGIRNGIDTARWDPARDRDIAEPFEAARLQGKDRCRAELCRELGWPADDPATIVGMVTRLADQKGVDLVLDTARFLDCLPARLVMVGAGSKPLAEAAHRLAAQSNGRLYFREGYDDAFGHRIFAGADLFAMPSRFEPCGLAQMQAMAYGTIPVTSDVGGLHDTVIDDDRHRGEGNGFVSLAVDEAGFTDALHRAVRATKHAARRRAIQRRGMTADWSWRVPAEHHLALYDEILVVMRTMSA